MWKRNFFRFSVYRTCVAICTDGSCNDLYKNTTSFIELCPFDIYTFLDTVDALSEIDGTSIEEDDANEMEDVPVSSPAKVTKQDENIDKNIYFDIDDDSADEDEDEEYSAVRIAQHYNFLEDMVIQYFLDLKIDIDNVSFEN